MTGYLWDVENPDGYANAMGRYKGREEMAFIMRHMPHAPMRILDVGGGTGRFAIPLAAAGHSVTVVDIAQDALDLLESREPERIRTHRADFCALEFNDVFDLVLGMESIQYFTHVRLSDLFGKVRSLLRPAGRFVFTELNERSWRYALRAFRGPERPAYNVASPAGYGAALETAGFNLLEMEGFVWMPLPGGSNSCLVSVFAAAEAALRLKRWTDQSPWLLIAAERP